MRTALEVVPKLGVKSGTPALRVGAVATYDRPIEHLAGHLDVLDLRVPIRAKDGRYGLSLCFTLAPVSMDRLAFELVRVTHPDGAIWIVVWKKDVLPDGASSWEEAQEAMLETGWVDNKILSLGAEVYAARYVRRRRPGKRERAALLRTSLSRARLCARSCCCGRRLQRRRDDHPLTGSRTERAQPGGAQVRARRPMVTRLPTAGPSATFAPATPTTARSSRAPSSLLTPVGRRSMSFPRARPGSTGRTASCSGARSARRRAPWSGSRRCGRTHPRRSRAW